MRSVMSPRQMTLSDVNGLTLDADEGTQALHMTEEAFRTFYERTARPLWAYLARATGEPHTADDLLQDAYYRLLRSTVAFDNDAHRRNYLFRIATNLVRDRHRRPSREVALPDDDSARPLACEDGAPARFQTSTPPRCCFAGPASEGWLWRITHRRRNRPHGKK